MCVSSCTHAALHMRTQILVGCSELCGKLCGRRGKKERSKKEKSKEERSKEEPSSTPTSADREEEGGTKEERDGEGEETGRRPPEELLPVSWVCWHMQTGHRINCFVRMVQMY